MIPRGVLATVLLVGAPAASACSQDAAATPQRAVLASDAAGPTRACDSARAARVALDSLARLDPFRSAVLRFARDTAGARIVTWPVQPPRGRITDGMAIVRVGHDCRIVSLFRTDSA